MSSSNENEKNLGTTTQEQASSAQTSAAAPAPVRIRSRFPKAQPNIAVTSGLARIRRLSGHYSTNSQDATTLNTTTVHAPATPVQNNSGASGNEVNNVVGSTENSIQVPPSPSL